MGHLANEPLFLNRVVERRTFKKMIERSTPAHIFLIQAQSGMGKTLLLEQFWQMSAHLPRARIDLKASFSIDRILFNLCEQLDTTQFPRFFDRCLNILGRPAAGQSGETHDRKRLKRLLSQHCNLTDLKGFAFDLQIDHELFEETHPLFVMQLIEWLENHGRVDEFVALLIEERPDVDWRAAAFESGADLTWIEGKRETQIKMKNMVESQREAYIALLTSAFMADLKERLATFSRPIVLLFDTYEAAGREVRAWLSEKFLEDARLLPDLVTVIAGQRIPNIDVWHEEWCLNHTLKEFRREEIYQFIEELNLELDDIVIKSFCDGSRGQPHLLGGLLANLMKMKGENR